MTIIHILKNIYSFHYITSEESMYYFPVNQIKSVCIIINAIKFDINYYLIIVRGSSIHTHFSLINFTDCRVIYDEIALFPKHHRITFHTFWFACDLMATIHPLIASPLYSTEFQVTQLCTHTSSLMTHCQIPLRFRRTIVML